MDNQKKAVLSVFFEVSDVCSPFLRQIGVDQDTILPSRSEKIDLSELFGDMLTNKPRYLLYNQDETVHIIMTEVQKMCEAQLKILKKDELKDIISKRPEGTIYLVNGGQYNEQGIQTQNNEVSKLAKKEISINPNLQPKIQNKSSKEQPLLNTESSKSKRSIVQQQADEIFDDVISQMFNKNEKQEDASNQLKSTFIHQKILSQVNRPHYASLAQTKSEAISLNQIYQQQLFVELNKALDDISQSNQLPIIPLDFNLLLDEQKAIIYPNNSNDAVHLEGASAIVLDLLTQIVETIKNQYKVQMFLNEITLIKNQAQEVKTLIEQKEKIQEIITQVEKVIEAENLSQDVPEVIKDEYSQSPVSLSIPEIEAQIPIVKQPSIVDSSVTIQPLKQTVSAQDTQQDMDGSSISSFLDTLDQNVISINKQTVDIPESLTKITPQKETQQQKSVTSFLDSLSGQVSQSQIDQKQNLVNELTSAIGIQKNLENVDGFLNNMDQSIKKESVSNFLDSVSSIPPVKVADLVTEKVDQVNKLTADVEALNNLTKVDTLLNNLDNSNKYTAVDSFVSTLNDQLPAVQAEPFIQAVSNISNTLKYEENKGTVSEVLSGIKDQATKTDEQNVINALELIGQTQETTQQLSNVSNFLDTQQLDTAHLIQAIQNDKYISQPHPHFPFFLYDNIKKSSESIGAMLTSVEETTKKEEVKYALKEVEVDKQNIDSAKKASEAIDEIKRQEEAAKVSKFVMEEELKVKAQREQKEDQAKADEISDKVSDLINSIEKVQAPVIDLPVPSGDITLKIQEPVFVSPNKDIDSLERNSSKQFMKKMQQTITDGLTAPNLHTLDKYDIQSTPEPIDLTLDQFTLSKMGRETSKLISDLSSNAFEVKFNQININKAKEQTFAKTNSYLENKKKTYMDVMHQSIIDAAEEYFDMKLITNQGHIQQVVESERFDKLVSDIVGFKNASDRRLRQRAIENIINQYPTIIDRYFRPKSNINNDELVEASFSSPSGLQVTLSKQAHQASIISNLLDQFLDVTPEAVTNLTASHNLNKRLNAQNDFTIEKQIIKHRDDLEIEKLRLRNQDQDKVIKGIDNSVQSAIEGSAQAKSNRTSYEMGKLIEKMSFEGRLVNDIMKQMPIMGDVKMTTVQGVRLKTDYEKMYAKDQNKQHFMSDEQGNLGVSMKEKIDDQLLRDDWLQGKWDDKKVIDTQEELESYMLHKFVAPELLDQSQVQEIQTKTVSLAQKRSDLQQGICSTGKQQSPLNIAAPFDFENSKSSIQLSYQETSDITVRLRRDFKNGMIFIQGSWGSIDYEGESFKMYGGYIHTPSEHTFGEQHLIADLELQLLHYSAVSNKILMLSLLFEVSETPNHFLESLNLNQLIKDDSLLSQDYEASSLNFTQLFDQSLETAFKENYHVRYEGSLTYEPCTEGVTWIMLLEKFKKLSPMQMEDLKMLVHGKQQPRETQHFNGRKIYLA